jgi:YD repeat-containing protein
VTGRDGSQLTATRDGFRVSAGFVLRHDLARATTVRLYYDRAHRTVGFHFLIGATRAEGTRRLKRHAGGFVVRAEGFFTAHGLDPVAYAGRYEAREVKDRALGRLFVIAPRRQATKTVTAPKARQAAA